VYFQKSSPPCHIRSSVFQATHFNAFSKLISLLYYPNLFIISKACFPDIIPFIIFSLCIKIWVVHILYFYIILGELCSWFFGKCDQQHGLYYPLLWTCQITHQFQYSMESCLQVSMSLRIPSGYPPPCSRPPFTRPTPTHL
jgi:hypothetical protein